VKTRGLTYDVLEPFTHDAGAERASGASHHSFCDGGSVLLAKSSGGLDNGGCGGTESINKSPIIGRSVVGTFGYPGGNRNWAYSNRANLRPELILVLHLLLHTPVRSLETARAAVSHRVTTRTRPRPGRGGLALARHSPY
jgi:hypothetical protein